MEDMSKRCKSLTTTKGKDNSHKTKPIVAEASYINR